MGDEHAEPERFSAEAQVFRGGDMQQTRWLMRNALEIKEELDIWALSTGCDPTLSDIQAVARASDYDGYLMMVSTVGRLRAEQFDVVPDRQYVGDVHALLILKRPPTGEDDSLWAELRGLFDGPIAIQREEGGDAD